MDEHELNAMLNSLILFIMKYMVLQFTFIFFLIIWDYFLLKIDSHVKRKYGNLYKKIDMNLSRLIRRIKLNVLTNKVIKNCRSYYISSGSFTEYTNQQLYKKITSNSLHEKIYKLVYFFFGPLKRNAIVLLGTIYFYTDLIQNLIKYNMGAKLEDVSLGKIQISILPSFIVLLVIISSIYFLSSKGKINRTVLKMNQDRLSIKIKFHIKNAKLIRKLLIKGCENNNYLFEAKNNVITEVIRSHFPNIDYITENDVIFRNVIRARKSILVEELIEIEAIVTLYEKYSKDVEDGLFNLITYIKRLEWFEVDNIFWRLEFDRICFTPKFFDQFLKKWEERMENVIETRNDDDVLTKETILKFYKEIDKELNFIIIENIESLIYLYDYCKYVEKNFKKTPFLFDFFGHITNKDK